MNLFFDRRVLPIGTDSLLAVASQVIACVQLRTADRQPDQLDPERARLALRDLGRMTIVLVQHERHLPSSVVFVDQPEELPEIRGTLLLPLQEQPCAAGDIKCAEDHALRVGPAQWDLGVFPTWRPQARNGGNSRRSVSSSKRNTSRGPNPLMYWRIRRISAARRGSGTKT